jgi:hypothetical protein
MRFNTMIGLIALVGAPYSEAADCHANNCLRGKICTTMMSIAIGMG